VTWELRRSLDVPRIEGVVQERFAKEFIDPGVDIFAANSHPLFVLYQIGSYNPQSAEIVNRYAMDLLEKEPMYIGKLIDGFLIEFPGGPNNGFNIEQLKSVYDVRRLGELAVKAGDHAWTTEKERRAIESFLSLAGMSERDEATGEDPEE
jgi:hypothetical protein